MTLQQNQNLIEQVTTPLILSETEVTNKKQATTKTVAWQTAGRYTSTQSAKRRQAGFDRYQKELDANEYILSTTKSLARLNSYIKAKSLNIANMTSNSVTAVITADPKLYYAFIYIQRHSIDDIVKLSPTGNLENLKKVLSNIDLYKIFAPQRDKKKMDERAQQIAQNKQRAAQSTADRAAHIERLLSDRSESDTSDEEQLFTEEQVESIRRNRMTKTKRDAASINMTAKDNKQQTNTQQQAAQTIKKQVPPLVQNMPVLENTTERKTQSNPPTQAATAVDCRRLFSFESLPVQNTTAMFHSEEIDAWDLTLIMSSVISNNVEVGRVIEDHLMSIDACSEVEDNKKRGGAPAERKNDGIDKFLQRARRVIQGKERDQVMDIISRNLNDKKWCKCLVDAAMYHHNVAVMGTYNGSSEEVELARADIKRYVFMRYLNIVKIWLEDKSEEIVSVASMRMVILHTLYRTDKCMGSAALEQMLAGVVKSQGTKYNKRAIETIRVASEVNFKHDPSTASTTIELEIVEEVNNINYIEKKLVKVTFDNSKNVEALARAHNALMHSITGNGTESGTNAVFIKDWNMLVDDAKANFSSKIVTHACDQLYDIAASRSLYRKQVRNTRTQTNALHVDFQITEAPLSIDLRLIQDETIQGRWCANNIANYGAMANHAVGHNVAHFAIDANIAPQAAIAAVVANPPHVVAVAQQAAILGHRANENGYGRYLGSAAYCVGTSAQIQGSTVYKKTLGITFMKFNGIYQDTNAYSTMSKQLAHYANKHTIKLMSDHVTNNATETTTSGKVNELMKIVGYAAARTPMMGPSLNIDGYTNGTTINVPEPLGPIFPLGEANLALGNIMAITMTMSAYIKWHETGEGRDAAGLWRSDMINNTIAVIPITTDMSQCRRTLAAMTLIKLEYPYQRLVRERPILLNGVQMTYNQNHSQAGGYNAAHTHNRNNWVGSTYTNVRMPSNITRIIYVLVDPQLVAASVCLDHPNRAVGIPPPRNIGAAAGAAVPVLAAAIPLIDITNQGVVTIIGAAGFAAINIGHHLHMWFESLTAIDWYRTADMIFEAGLATHEQMSMAQRKMAQLCPLYTPMQASRHNGGANDLSGLVDFRIGTAGANMQNSHEAWRADNTVEEHAPTCWSLLTNSIGQRMLPRAEIQAGVATSKVSAHDDRVDVLLAARICTLLDPMWSSDIYQPTLQATYKLNELSLTYAKLVDMATNTLGLPFQIIGGGSDATAIPFRTMKEMSQRNLIGCAESEMFQYSDDLDHLSSLADIGAVISTRLMINSYRGNYRPITTAAQEANGHLLFAKERPLVRTFLRTSYQEEIKDYRHVLNLKNWHEVDDNDMALSELVLRSGSIQLSTQTARDLLTTLPMTVTQNAITALVKRVRASQHAGVAYELWYTYGDHQLITPLNVLLENPEPINYRIPFWSNPFVFDFNGATKCTAHVINDSDIWTLDDSELLTIATYSSDLIRQRKTIERRVYNIDPLARKAQLTELEQKLLADADAAQTKIFLDEIERRGVDVHDLKGRFLPPDKNKLKKHEERKEEEDDAEKKRIAALLKEKDDDAANNRARTGFDIQEPKQAGAGGAPAGVNI